MPFCSYKLLFVFACAGLLAGCETSARPSSYRQSQATVERDCQRMMSGRDTSSMSPEQRKEMMRRCMHQREMMGGSGAQEQAPSTPYNHSPSGRY